jgi:hypothetical protein
MDIYKTSTEIIQLYRSQYSPEKDKTLADKERALNEYNQLQDKFKQINFSEPLFKGYSISESCNPVSCRLIIFFTDTLVPYFIKNIISNDDAQIVQVILNFTAVFNFIFYLIFDKYEYNEKKWIVQQINTLLKGLSTQKNIDFFKQNICISFEEQPIVKITDKNCNFIMQISEEESNPYYVDDVLLEELKKVLKRCLPFWKIGRYDKAEALKGIDYTYKIGVNETKYSEIHFSPICLDTPNQIQLFPIQKDIGNTIFRIFSNYDTLFAMTKPSKTVLAKINSLLSRKTEIEAYTQTVISSIKELKLTPHDIELINKFLVCSYVFIILQIFNIFPKNKKYPETYDEIFTMFSNIDSTKIATITTLEEAISKFFLPIHSAKVGEYSRGRTKTKQIVDSSLKSEVEQVKTSPVAISEEHQLLQEIEELKKGIPKEKITNINNSIREIYFNKYDDVLKIDTLKKIIRNIEEYKKNSAGGSRDSRSTKKTSIKKKILKKPKKTIRNTK